jgi:hypothetical protein
MKAYLLTASATRFRIRPATVAGESSGGRMPLSTFCASLIVCAENADEAQQRFEESVCAQPEGESQTQTQILRIVAAQFVDQLLTEKEFVPPDWPQIARQAQADMESTPADDFEQGYWVDLNAVCLPSADIGALRQDLPEDIRSGLNWAEDKQFFFLLSVLSPPPPPPPESADEPEAGAAKGEEPPDETEGDSAGTLEPEADFPELVNKEAAVLIRARNSAVAAWLWRKYAAGTNLAGHQIRIDPWFGVIGLELKDPPS